MASISQIQIGNTTYDLYDANAARSTNVNTIDSRLNTIENYFTGGKLNLANGGTALSSTDQNALLRTLGLAKTVGDTINIGTINVAGFIASSANKCSFSFPMKYRCYDCSGIQCTGFTVTIRSYDGSLKFGTNTGEKALSNYTVASNLYFNHINMDITGSSQGDSLKNTTCTASFKNLTFQLT